MVSINVGLIARQTDVSRPTAALCSEHRRRPSYASKAYENVKATRGVADTAPIYYSASVRRTLARETICRSSYDAPANRADSDALEYVPKRV